MGDVKRFLGYTIKETDFEYFSFSSISIWIKYIIMLSHNRISFNKFSWYFVNFYYRTFTF